MLGSQQSAQLQKSPAHLFSKGLLGSSEQLGKSEVLGEENLYSNLNHNAVIEHQHQMKSDSV